jgi:hypothetical protein
VLLPWPLLLGIHIRSFVIVHYCAFQTFITLVKITMEPFAIFIRFGEGCFIFNGRCWGMSLAKRWNSLC